MGKEKMAQPSAQLQKPLATIDSELTPYEIERMALIARNRERMVQLGIPMAAQELSAIMPLKSSAPKPRAPKAKAPPSKQQPTKRSKRVKGEAAEPCSRLPNDDDDEDDKELEEKKPQKKTRKTQAPKANAVPRHPNLPSVYTGLQRDQLTEEETKRQTALLAATEDEHVDAALGLSTKNFQTFATPQTALLAATEDERLAAIQLEGLVSWTDEQATFVVKGSRGDNYLVSISDVKNTCQCMDHRIRKRNCKHIVLILTNLGLLECPVSWQEAVREKFMLTAKERVQKGLKAIADAMGLGSLLSAPPLSGDGSGSSSRAEDGAAPTGPSVKSEKGAVFAEIDAAVKAEEGEAREGCPQVTEGGKRKKGANKGSAKGGRVKGKLRQ